MSHRMWDRGTRWALAGFAGLVAAGVLLGACGSGKGAGPQFAATDASNVEYSTPLLQVMSAGIVDGRLDRETALKVFAWQVGPLPGVTPPKGSPGVVASATPALRSLFAEWEALQEDQRVAVRNSIGAPADFAPNALPPAGPGRRGQVTGTLSTEFPAETSAVLGVLEARLGPLPTSLFVTKATRSGDDLGLTYTGVGDDGYGCYVQVTPAGRASKRALLTTLGHEIFHCYQGAWSPTFRAWTWEGTAEWVGANVAESLGVPIDASTVGYFQDYSSTAGASLFVRSYDAIGWFGYIAETSDLWAKLESIIRARGDIAAYEAATAGMGADVVTRWGSSASLFGALGEPWTITGPGVPNRQRPYAGGGNPLKNGGKTVLVAPAYAGLWSLQNITADLVAVTVTGPGNGLDHSSAGDRDLRSLQIRTWCTNPKGVCKCPDTSRDPSKTFPKLASGDHVIGIGGGADDTIVELRGISLEEECGKGSCLVGSWRLDGPPVGGEIRVPSGLTGTLLEVDADGSTTYDLTPSEPLVLENEGVTIGVKYSGTITAQAGLPTDPAGGPVAFTALDFSGLTSENLTINGASTIGGIPTSVISDQLTDALRTGLFNGAGALDAACPGDKLTLTGPGGTLTFSKTGR